MHDGAVVFVSDAHFGSGAAEPERRRGFVRFMGSLHGSERVVIAGDLFQFWFDLGGSIPSGYFDILEALSRLRRSGTRVDYLAGNHDYWRGDFFRRELGIETHAGELILTTQGRRIRVSHGDGEGPGDRGYKLLRRVVRSPVVVGAARLVHPALLYGAAHAMGRWSRAHTGMRPPDTARLEAAARTTFARGFDALVLGHVHAQLHRHLPGGELLVIGDWLELRSWVRLQGGTFTTGRWQE
jgi:UDP-2,3-diacylglucosamine hydrolase